MLGRLLATRYRIIKALAQGGFGKTYLAEDILLPGVPHCVVKQLTVGQDNAAALGIARRLFSQEAITLQKLGKHSQIPQLYAYFEENNGFFLVQELIEGISLKEEFDQIKQLTELQGIELLRDCLGTLVFVHGLGVIHRDIKPANLMRRQVDGKIILLDFGAVKEIEINQSQLAETTVSIGTQGYMPDEQLRGKPQFASDIYALGMTCLQGLTATHPRNFERDDKDEICWQNLLSLHPALEQLLSKMVRRDSRHRYSQVTEILADLDHHFGPATPSTVETGDTTGSLLPETNTYANSSRTYSSNNQSAFTPISQTRQQKNVQNGSNTRGHSQEEIEASDAPTIVSEQGNQQLTSDITTSAFLQSDEETLETSAKSPPTALQACSSPTVNSVNKVPATTQVQSIDSELRMADQRSGSSTMGEMRPVLTRSSDVLNKPVEVRQNDFNQQAPKQSFKSLKWIVPSMLLLCIGAGVFWLRRPSASAQMLKQLESLYTQKKFTDCIRIGESAVSDPDIPESSISGSLAQCHLGAAQAQADQGNYGEALKIAAKVPSNNAHHGQAQQKVNAWSRQLLNQAKDLYLEKGELQKALALTRLIPKSSDAHEQATKLSKQWQENHNTNEKLVNEAQVALDKGQAESAIAKAEQVKQPKFWKQKAENIIQIAEAEIANRSVVANPVPTPTTRTGQPAPQPAPAPSTTKTWQPVPPSIPASQPTPRPAPRNWPSETPAPRAWPSSS